jgi:hypothetical protein
MDTDEGMYKATPQIKGTLVHEGVDHKTSSTKKTDIFSIHVYSDTLGVSGKIDVYKTDKKQLIERKNNLKQIFRGLICDIMEPFRCIIDHTILLAFHRGQFKDKDFIKLKGEIHFKYEKSSVYYNVFFKVLIDYKTEIFKYVQQYYRCFMGRKSAQQFPIFVYQ